MGVRTQDRRGDTQQRNVTTYALGSQALEEAPKTDTAACGHSDAVWSSAPANKAQIAVIQMPWITLTDTHLSFTRSPVSAPPREATRSVVRRSD
jgi:hypothetical protein